jgi:chromosome segregation ATPase
MVQMGLIDLASDVLVEDEMILRSALDHPDINKSLLAAYLRLLDESRATIRSLEETSARLRRVRDSELVHTVHEATVLRRTLEGLQREHRDLWAEIERLRKLRDRVRQDEREIERLREELRSVYLSTSWRALGGVRRFLSSRPRTRRLFRGALLLFSRG